MKNEEKNVFFAGAGRADITPEVGTLLYGYRPDVVSESVHDRLNVTAAAFRQAGETVILLSATVGDIQTELTNEILAKVSEATGIPSGKILLSATHTHSAPNVAGFEGWGDVDRPYVEKYFTPGIIKAAKEALESLAPAVMATGRTHSDVGINRREQMPNGWIGLGQNPWGCYDPNMTVMCFKNADTGNGIINMIHYGCHGTAAGCNHEISRDWSGIMCDRVEKLTGTMTGFWNGSIGDVGPRLTNGFTTGDISYVEELGGVAAQDAIRAYNCLSSYSEPALRLFSGTVKLPYKPLEDEETVKKALAAIKNPDSLVNIERLTYSHLKDVEEFYRKGEVKSPEALGLPTAIVAVGDAVFIPIPFEIFSEISMRLRAYLKKDYTDVMVLSNTNGYYCYLPAQDQLCLGGYEVDCFLNAGLFLLQNNTDQHFIDEVLRIISENK